MNAENINIKGFLLIQEAMKRGYEVEIISEEFNLFFISIYGKKILFKNDDFGLRSSFSYKVCKSKIVTNFLLNYYGISVPQYDYVKKGNVIDTNQISFPVVVKPHDRSCNKGVTIGINNEKHLYEAMNLAYEYSDKVLVQKYVEGDLFRVFVLDGKVVSVTMLVPPFVVGNGSSTIKELIDIENASSYRGTAMLDPLYPIEIESQLLLHLESLGYSLDSVLPQNLKIILRNNPQLSLGGVTQNLSLSLHPSLEAACIKATSLLGLPWSGIDVLSKDIESDEYAIIEVNAQPDFKMHQYPAFGEPLNISSLLLDFISQQ